MSKKPEQKLCEECNKPIPKARLKVLPHTKYCVNCAAVVEVNEPQDDSMYDDSYNPEDCRDIISDND